MNRPRLDFNFDVNRTTDVYRRTKAGSLFRSLGPETEKIRLPNFEFVRGTANEVPRVDYLSPLELESEHGVTMDVMYYGGEVPDMI